jgi:hypothetical protein
MDCLCCWATGVSKERRVGAGKKQTLSRQRPLQFGIFEQGHFVSFGELQGTFEGAADVVGAGAHSEIVGDKAGRDSKRSPQPIPPLPPPIRDHRFPARTTSATFLPARER